MKSCVKKKSNKSKTFSDSKCPFCVEPCGNEHCAYKEDVDEDREDTEDGVS